MDTKDVYVVYGTEKEEILSVHADQKYASIKRRDFVRDELSKIRKTRYLNSDDTTMATMHYVVIDLETALTWLKTANELT